VVYTIDVDHEAREQIRALPAVVLTALAEAMTVLTLTPWNSDPINKENPDGAVRMLLFNPRGMITYLIVEDQCRVDVLQVTWAS
jgi:hypothetical protein